MSLTVLFRLAELIGAGADHDLSFVRTRYGGSLVEELVVCSSQEVAATYTTVILELAQLLSDLESGTASRHPKVSSRHLLAGSFHRLGSMLKSNEMCAIQDVNCPRYDRVCCAMGTGDKHRYDT